MAIWLTVIALMIAFIAFSVLMFIWNREQDRVILLMRQRFHEGGINIEEAFQTEVRLPEPWIDYERRAEEPDITVTAGSTTGVIRHKDEWTEVQT